MRHTDPRTRHKSAPPSTKATGGWRAYLILFNSRTRVFGDAGVTAGAGSEHGNDMMKSEGNVIAVTGAASGIGRALARELVTRGHRVALSDVDEAGLNETMSLLDDANRATATVVDVRDGDAMAAWADAVAARHGGVGGVINNAGLAARGSVGEMPYEKFKRVIDVDMWGVVHGVRSFLPHLRARGGGHIVNISSVNGFVPFANNGPYNMAKYAVLGLSETLLQELDGEPIHVTSVHPGGVRTNVARNADGYDENDAKLFERMARTHPRDAAAQILDGMERGQPYVYVGRDAKVMAAAKRLLPAVTVRAVGVASAAITSPKDTGSSGRVWIDHTSELNADVDEVEALLRDIDRWPSWTPGLLAVRRRDHGPIRHKSRFTMVLKPKGALPAAIPCKVLRLEPGILEWGGGIAGSMIRHSFQYEAIEGGGTRVRHLEYATGLLDHLTRPVEHIAARHDRAWSEALEARFGTRSRHSAFPEKRLNAT